MALKRSDYLALLYDMVEKRTALDKAIDALSIAYNSGAIVDPPEGDLEKIT
jgi:hypothetical protein